eukprot:768485-Hanusia_phi.AAC.4
MLTISEADLNYIPNFALTQCANDGRRRAGGSGAGWLRRRKWEEEKGGTRRSRSQELGGRGLRCLLVSRFHARLFALDAATNLDICTTVFYHPPPSLLPTPT